LRRPERNEDSQWRERGYREALEANGILFEPSLVTVGGFNEDKARDAMQE
jgi:DNA-binding LacI/PurR family transcriptional regulator